jgi:hypothetical protein
MEDRNEFERVCGALGEPQETGSDDPTDGEGHELEQDEPSPTASPATQIGRAEQTGGTPAGREAGVESREGWPMPDQSDTPKEWPEPTID